HPRAYAALGRGIDLPNLIHEWGGDPGSLRMLLGSIRKVYPGCGILGSPELLERFGLATAAGGMSAEFLCMARIIDPARLLEGYFPPSQVPRVACSPML